MTHLEGCSTRLSHSAIPLLSQVSLVVVRSLSSIGLPRTHGYIVIGTFTASKPPDTHPDCTRLEDDLGEAGQNPSKLRREEHLALCLPRPCRASG